VTLTVKASVKVQKVLWAVVHPVSFVSCLYFPASGLRRSGVLRCVGSYGWGCGVSRFRRCFVLSLQDWKCPYSHVWTSKCHCESNLVLLQQCRVPTCAPE
jgi:hypothetical protein